MTADDPTKAALDGVLEANMSLWPESGWSKALLAAIAPCLPEI